MQALILSFLQSPKAKNAALVLALLAIVYLIFMFIQMRQKITLNEQQIKINRKTLL